MFIYYIFWGYMTLYHWFSMINNFISSHSWFYQRFISVYKVYMSVLLGLTVKILSVISHGWRRMRYGFVGFSGEEPSSQLPRINKPLDHRPFRQQDAMQPAFSSKVTYGGVWTQMSTLTKTGNLFPMLNVYRGSNLKQLPITDSTMYLAVSL